MLCGSGFAIKQDYKKYGQTKFFMNYRNLKLNEVIQITSIFYLERTKKGLIHYVKKDGNLDKVGFEEFEKSTSEYNPLYW